MPDLTGEEILGRLSQGYDPAHEDADDWDETLNDLINHGDPQVDEDSVKAFATLLEKETSDRFDDHQFRTEFGRRYRYYWSSPGKFAREYFAAEWADMGDNPNGRSEALQEFAEFINWDEYADSPEMSDYTFINLNPGGVSGVHAFQD